jgi:hypothetical protein
MSWEMGFMHEDVYGVPVRRSFFSLDVNKEKRKVYRNIKTRHYGYMGQIHVIEMK